MNAIQNNDFLRNLERVQVTEIVDCMYERVFTKEQYICREGGVGTQLYVISGKGYIRIFVKVCVSKNNRMLMC